MPAHRKLASIAAVTALALLPASAAFAASDPTGVWINDTGRGAIEIKNCGAALCGHVVWVKDTNDKKGCGRQIIGNAAKVGDGVWDNGWIYSPEKKQKYDVELKPLSNGTLKVTGYAGTKFFSKSMIWKRAPADLVRCGAEETVAKADAAAKPGANKPEAEAKAEAAKAKAEPKQPAKQKDEVAKSEPKIVPPAPKPAERPAKKPDVEQAAPIDVARADPQPERTAPPVATKTEPGPGVAATGKAEQLPQDHALPGIENNEDAPAVAAPDEDESEPPSLDMGKIAKRLAEIERETGYGLKKTGDGNCRLKVPYATVNFPCKD